MPTGGESLKGVQFLVWMVLGYLEVFNPWFLLCVPFSTFRMFLVISWKIVNRGMRIGMDGFQFWQLFFGRKFGKKEFIPFRLTLASKMRGAGVLKLMHEITSEIVICSLHWSNIYLYMLYLSLYGHNVLSCRNAFIRDRYDCITCKITYANGSVHFMRYIHLTLDCLRVSITYVM